MNFIWIGLIIFAFVFGALNGKLEDVVNAMLSSSARAVEVAFSLIGIMAFWLGIMKIAEKSGLVEWFSKLISPIVRLVFNELPKNSPAISDIAMNFTANALGLANAATPFGIKAMEELQKEGAMAHAVETSSDTLSDINSNKEVATNSMCTFLGMNTAGFQLVPTTVLALLVAAGAKNPAEIIIPTIIVTTIAFVFAIVMSRILQRFFKEEVSK